MIWKKLLAPGFSPWFYLFAINITMALTLNPSSHQRMSNNTVETNEELYSQLAKSQEEADDLKNRLLQAEAKIYILANHLQEHRCEGYKDLIESVLRKKPQLLAEDMTSAENQKKCYASVQELPQLQEGSALCLLLHQRLQDIFRQQDSENCQGQDLLQRLAELLKLTEHLAGKLSPVQQTHEDVTAHQESPSPRHIEEQQCDLEEANILQGPRIDPCMSSKTCDMKVPQTPLHVEDPFLHSAQCRPSYDPSRMEALKLSPGLTAEDRGCWPITTQEAVEPQQCIENNHDLMQEDHLVQAIRLGASLLDCADDDNTLGAPEHRLSPELPEMEQFDVPAGSAVTSPCLYSLTTHVASCYTQTYSNEGDLVQEQRVFMSVRLSVGQTPAAPGEADSPQSRACQEQPWQEQCDVPPEHTENTYWACSVATHVAATYHQASTSGYSIVQEEHHCMVMNLIMTQTSADEEDTFSDSPQDSRPSHEPRWMEAIEACTWTTGEAWESQPMTAQVAVEPQQMFDSSTDPSQEDHLAQAILQGAFLLSSPDDNSAFDASLHVRPSQEPPWMEANNESSGCTGESGGTQPVPPVVALEPQQLFSISSLPVQEDYLCQTILQGASLLSSPDDNDASDASKIMPNHGPPRMAAFEALTRTPREAWGSRPATPQVPIKPQDMTDSTGDPVEENDLVQAVLQGASLLSSLDDADASDAPVNTPSQEPPWMETNIGFSISTGEAWGSRPMMPRMAIEPQQMSDISSDLMHDDHLCWAILQGVYELDEQDVAGSLDPANFSLANPEQPEYLLSPVACSHPLSPISSLEDHTCTALGSNWDPMYEPQLCQLASVASPALGSAVESRSSPQLEADPPEMSARNSTACGVRSHLGDSDALRKAMIQKKAAFQQVETRTECPWPSTSSKEIPRTTRTVVSPDG
ncbi:uncharacterized protein LOC131483341 [Ochotona princeps]|uniref:uncharacterized protein LOC131483341 n=1 Tax=Ochotona princeps TaxID=9978 RepID=UPI002714E45C|nr:uncharacterized protein LOC131483341 [Ochotona princeps]